MSNLPTNYVDDVLNADVNTRRKYQMIQNGDGTVSLVDVTDYDTVGSSIGAAQINAQNTQINQNTEDISSLNQHLTELREEMKLMGVPLLDYANPIHTFDSSHLTFTATKVCYLQGSISAWNGGNGNVTINGTNVAHAGSWTGDTSSVSIAILKLKAGDVVTASYACDMHVFDVISN